MNSAADLLSIKEYKSEVINDLVDKDIAYLQRECFKATAENPPYKIRKLRDNKVEIENTSYSGVIQLDKIRIHFSTKVKANLFYMLSFLKDEQSFLYDPEVVIDIKEGANFFDILGRLFLNELEEIFKKGLSIILKMKNPAFAGLKKFIFRRPKIPDIFQKVHDY